MNAIPYFDAHCDTLYRCAETGCGMLENDGHLDLKRLLEFERAGQIFAIYHDMANAPADGLFAACKRQQQILENACQRYEQHVTQCRTGAQIDDTHKAGKVAAVLSVEGAELLDCDPDKLDWARQAGVRCINLTWNHANALSGSNLHEPERGLNDLGRAFVRRAQQYDILMDVSHLSDAGFWDLVDMTCKPIVATHSNSRALCGHSRNLTDDMFRAVMETGGVVGLNLWVAFVSDSSDTADMEAVLRHVDHFMDLGGAKHLCLGADLDGCDRLAGGMTGVQDMDMLWQALSQHGYSRQELSDLFYNNLRRVLN